MHSWLRVRLLSKPECSEVVSLVQALTLEPAKTDGVVTRHRQGLVGWLPREVSTEWLHQRLEQFGIAYAKSKAFDVGALDSPLQYAEYDAGCEFDWHIDAGTDSTRYRKVTISVQLSSAVDYDGGDLELVGEVGSHLQRTQGAAIAFASVLGHRVTRVTQGRRRALVGWMTGPPFR
jgi:predicted 2-oxoglutarate/Fe(II)-dependent dioxygenase YbiX